MIAKNISNLFWKEVLNALSCFQTLCKENTCTADILVGPLWYNSDILIGNKPVYFETLNDNGITHVCDLFNEDCKFLDLQGFNIKLGFKPDITHVNGFKHAIKKWPELWDLLGIPCKDRKTIQIVFRINNVRQKGLKKIV